MFFFCYLDKTSIVKILIDNGADVNARDNRRNTALHRTTNYGNSNFIIQSS